MVALVAESGSGKSTLTKAILAGPPPAQCDRWTHRSGRYRYPLALSKNELRTNRSEDIGLVPQDPGGSLHPVNTVGSRLGEVFRLHRQGEAHESRDRCIELLGTVDVDRPEQRLEQYPHELSDGL